jgi:beta-mannosidase
MPPALSPWRARVDGHEVRPLDHDWEASSTEPDANPTPADLADLHWLPARVPGTAAAVLRDAGQEPTPEASDGRDWWFRTRFPAPDPEAGDEVVLTLGGIATVAEVWLNGERVLESDSMFASHAIDVGARLRPVNELAIRCLALAPLLAAPRKPRARWRTRVVADGNLRWFRTMILGRAPGFAPGPPAVGPWRPIRLERRRGVAVDALDLRPRLDGEEGVLAVRAVIRTLAGAAPTRVSVVLDGPSGRFETSLAPTQGVAGDFSGELQVPSVARWWPHTHGEPVLHAVRLVLDGDRGPVTIDAGRVGFRTLAPGPGPDHDVERDGLSLHVNGVPVFARGAIWTPLDIVSLGSAPDALRSALDAVRGAGMNMLRLAGTGAYEDRAFHDVCDELGVLVWQDFMYANLDYPFADESFSAVAEAEAAAVLADLAGRPSLAVLCGNSEVEQQVAMLGLDPALAREPFFGTALPALVEAAGCDAVYVPSAPFGGARPFSPDRGVANYFGVGGYRRPLADARLADVRFAAECLAFANVPDDAVIESLVPGSPLKTVVHHPAWKAGVPRDAGSGWDFDDVRDHYLELLFGLDPVELRRVDHERYLELSRAVTGEVMAAVFGEWRRAASSCAGGLVLTLRDLVPGAGWGVLDHRGEPKVAYHHLRRALAPVAVWMSDEGMGGVTVHVANDGPCPLSARLRIALYHDHEQRVGEGEETVELDPHGSLERDVETLVGGFVDASWAYRFGPPAQDVIVASLERDGADGLELLSHAVFFPAGRPSGVEDAGRLGLEASLERADSGLRLAVRSKRLAYGVRVHIDDHVPNDDAFTVEPGVTRYVDLHGPSEGGDVPGGALTALNLAGRVPTPALDRTPR